jgi:hypothetical protein
MAIRLSRIAALYFSIKKRSIEMKKVLSVLVTAFVIVSFSGVVFAAEPATTEMKTIITKKSVAKKKKATYKKKAKKAKKAKSVQQKNNLPPKTQN